MDDNLEEKGCSAGQVPCNKGRLTGQKPPLKCEEIWAIRIRLQIAKNVRDLALFNLAIDSKLRACDLVKIRVIEKAGLISACHLLSRLEHVAPGQLLLAKTWFLWSPATRPA